MAKIDLTKLPGFRSRIEQSGEDWSQHSGEEIQEYLERVIDDIKSDGAELIDLKGEYQNNDCWLAGNLSDYNAGIANYVRYHQVDISAYVGQELSVRCFVNLGAGSGIVSDNGVVLLKFAESSKDIQTVVIPQNSKWLRVSNNTSSLQLGEVIMEVRYTKPIELPFRVVNDLTTGGDTDVLSAEMGKKIGTEIFGGYVNITPGQIEYDRAYLDELSYYNYGGTGCSRLDQIDVSAYTGLTMRIKAFVPSGKGVASGFVDANGGVISRLAFDSNDTQEISVDETAKYLRICFSSSKAGDVSVEVEQKGLADKIEPNKQDNPFVPCINMMGVKLKAIGDSITAGTNGGTSYVPIVAELLGIECENAGFPADTIQSMSNRNGYQKTDADIVTIFGGTNDYAINTPIGEYGSTESGFYKSLETAYNNHRANNAGTPIYFITPCARFDKSGENTVGAKLSDYVDAMLIFCAKKRIPVIDLYYSGVIKNVNYCISDKVHLNQEGATAVAKVIALAISLFEVSRRFSQ